jgi:hypothetical protein
MVYLYIIYKNRSDRKKFLKVTAIPAAVIVGLIVLLNIYESSRLPVVSGDLKPYTMEIKEVKKITGKAIELKKAILDLKRVSASYSVWGREKVVAVELKKNLDDQKPLNEMTGLWIGKRLFHDYASFGMSYNSEEILDPVYIIFYLSNGQSVPFEIRDKANVKNSVKVINVDKTIEYNSCSIKFTRFNKGLEWSWLGFEANFQPSGVTVKLLVDGKEVQDGNRAWAGGGDRFEGSFSFKPVNADKVQIKVINEGLNRVDYIDIKL